MPMYEFECPKCHTVFEELIFKDEMPPCTSCGNPETHKLLSRPCLHMPAPSRVGQTVTYPSSSSSACGSCAGGNCATCK